MNQKTLDEIYERKDCSRWRANDLDVVVPVAFGVEILLGDLVLFFHGEAHTPRSFSAAIDNTPLYPNCREDLMALAVDYFLGVSINASRGTGNVKVRTSTIFEFPLLGAKLGLNPVAADVGDLLSFAPDSLEWPTSLREQALRVTLNKRYAIAVAVAPSPELHATTVLCEIRSRIMYRGIGA